jgi:hypothetical protein
MQYWSTRRSKKETGRKQDGHHRKRAENETGLNWILN